MDSRDSASAVQSVRTGSVPTWVPRSASSSFQASARSNARLAAVHPREQRSARGHAAVAPGWAMDPVRSAAADRWQQAGAAWLRLASSPACTGSFRTVEQIRLCGSCTVWPSRIGGLRGAWRCIACCLVRVRPCVEQMSPRASRDGCGPADVSGTSDRVVTQAHPRFGEAIVRKGSSRRSAPQHYTGRKFGYGSCT